MTDNRQLHFEMKERRTPDSVCRELTLTADGEADRVVIEHEIFDTTVGALTVLDGPVQSVLMHCMKRGRPLRIHGNLSASSFYNLNEFQRAWSLWRPNLYGRIDLIPDAVVVEGPKSTKTIQAFSGGIDASFTLVSNKYLDKNRGGFDVSAGLLVHGFDVPYENTSGFARLAERVKKTLDRVGVELKLIRTNNKVLDLQSWMDSSALQLSACLHQFANHYGRALMGSNEPYDALVMTSSNPITDHLLSGDTMTIVHDGAGYSRTEKAEILLNFPFMLEGLKVCWEGSDPETNCGRCEKCLRTRLNFAASGCNDPPCFSGSFDKSMLSGLTAQTVIQVAELEGIMKFARRKRLSYPWLNALRRRIWLSRIAIPIKTAVRWEELRPWLRAKRNGVRRRAVDAPVRSFRKDAS
jgi:hypothetical protein